MIKRTSVINGLVSTDDVQLIAQNMGKIKSVTYPDSIRKDFSDMITKAYHATLSDYNSMHDTRLSVVYVDFDPYTSADEMRADMVTNKVLKITTLYNNPDENLISKRDNLIFRATHDIHHAMTGDCNFNLDGELCAYSKYAHYAIQLGYGYFIPHLACEIIGQASHNNFYGVFPEQVINPTVVPKPIIARVLSAYRV